MVNTEKEHVMQLCKIKNALMHRNNYLHKGIMFGNKTVFLPLLKLHSILATANLRVQNSINISYYVQVNSQWLKSSVASTWASKNL